MLGIVVLLVSTLFLVTKTYFKNDKDTGNHAIAMYVENESREYELSGNSSFPREGYKLNLKKSSCSNGGTLSQNETTKAINVTLSTEDKCVLYFDKENFNIPSAIKAIEMGLEPKCVNDYDPDLTKIATLNEGVFKAADDYGTSYYFRGAVDNNYVRFGKWSDSTKDIYVGVGGSSSSLNVAYSLEECQSSGIKCQLLSRAGKDMYWRIIRINGDGSVRLQYDGTEIYSNSAFNLDRMAIIKKPWNYKGDDSKYVGWMYGGEEGVASISKTQAQTNETDSNAKKLVDSWYEENFLGTKYHDYVADAIFCNDRSTATQPNQWLVNDTTLGYGNNITAFGAFDRFYSYDGSNFEISSAIFTCPQKNDAFTVSDTRYGNADGKYPVGLITTDELVFAGCGYTENVNNFLFKPVFYKTMTPIMFSRYKNSIVSHLNGFNASISSTIVEHEYASYVPVINIKVDYAKLLMGTGTANDPYYLP